MDLLKLTETFNESQMGKEQTCLSREPRIVQKIEEEDPALLKKAKSIGKNLLDFLNKK